MEFPTENDLVQLSQTHKEVVGSGGIVSVFIPIGHRQVNSRIIAVLFRGEEAAMNRRSHRDMLAFDNIDILGRNKKISLPIKMSNDITSSITLVVNQDDTYPNLFYGVSVFALSYMRSRL